MLIVNEGDIERANILVPEEAHMDLMTLDHLTMMETLSILVLKDTNYAIHPNFMHTEPIKKPGFFVKTGDKQCRIMLGGEFDPCIYRGQNQDFPFEPSFQRAKITQSPLLHCAEWIKKETFKEVFKETPYFKRLSNMSILGNTFDFDLEALAQHYEFSTNYLDITRDFNVAMFFAYTWTDVHGNYHPITDFEKFNPHLYITNGSTMNGFMRDNYKIVGFQSALRPVTQLAMAIDMDNTENDTKGFFTKIELPKNAYFSVGVYNSFQKGTALFPQDTLSVIQKDIKTTNFIARDLLHKYCETFSKDINEMTNLLKQDFEITDKKIIIPAEITEQINKEITLGILPWIKNNIGWRTTSQPA